MAQPWQPEVEVSAALAGRLIEQQFPELAPVELAPLGAGWDNWAFLANRQIVFRFPRREFALPFFANECRALPIIAPEMPLSIPCPRWLGVASVEYSWPFAGYPFLPGRMACTARLNDTQRAALAQPLAHFLRALHSLPTEPLRHLGVPNDSLGRLDFGKRIAQSEELLAAARERASIAQTDDFLPLIRSAERFAQPVANPVLVHGDMYARHLLVDDAGRLTGVIDWGDIHLNDPAADLMIVHRFLPPQAHADFLSEYGDVADTTWRRARFRAFNHTLLLHDFASETGDADLLLAAEFSLRYLRLAADA